MTNATYLYHVYLLFFFGVFRCESFSFFFRCFSLCWFETSSPLTQKRNAAVTIQAQKIIEIKTLRMNRFVMLLIFTWLCSITHTSEHTWSLSRLHRIVFDAVVREIYIYAKTKVNRPLNERFFLVETCDRSRLSAAHKPQLNAIYYLQNLGNNLAGRLAIKGFEINFPSKAGSAPLRESFHCCFFFCVICLWCEREFF